MTKIDIRPTQQADIPGMRKVLAETELFPQDMLGNLLGPYLDGPGEDIWLCAFQGDALKGFAYTVRAEMTEGTWNMLALGVRKHVQGKGLGAALVAATEDALRSHAAHLLIVDTSGTDAFADARTFYLARGFEEEARIRDYWAPGDDKITFRKAL